MLGFFALFIMPFFSETVASAHSHCDVYGNATWRLPIPGAAGAGSGATQDPSTFPCAKCQRMVTISKYAPHLEKCMGKNSRTSSRVQLRKGPEASANISYAAFDDKKKRKRCVFPSGFINLVPARPSSCTRDLRNMCVCIPL